MTMYSQSSHRPIVRMQAKKSYRHSWTNIPLALYQLLMDVMNGQPNR